MGESGTTEGLTSESHNEAMVRAAHHWAGYSNPYISDNPGNIGTSGKETDKHTGYCAQFDIYSETAPKSPWDLYSAPGSPATTRKR